MFQAEVDCGEQAILCICMLCWRQLGGDPRNATRRRKIGMRLECRVFKRGKE